MNSVAELATPLNHHLKHVQERRRRGEGERREEEEGQEGERREGRGGQTSYKVWWLSQHMLVLSGA
jgi:hypothetical protein